MAIELREPVADVERWQRPAWWGEIPGAAELRISPSNGQFDEVAAIVLDVLAAAGGSMSRSAAAMGVSTGALGTFLSADPAVWQKVASVRQAAGLKPLGNPRK